jgi:hypothetical protein
MSAGMHRTLDFSALPLKEFFSTRSIFTKLSDPIEARLSRLPLTLERTRSAVMFAEMATRKTEEWIAAAYLRAALTEFCSMEEVLKNEFPNGSPYSLVRSSNPLLHLLELIRHLNIHVRSVKAERLALPVTMGEHTFDLDVYIVSDLDPADLATLRNGKHYSSQDLSKMVDWFVKSQHYWGAGYIIRVGVEAFAEEIATHSGL